jgi:hypothetical protein
MRGRFERILAIALLVVSCGGVRAADLDGPPPTPRAARPSNCRVIPQPRLNLTKEDVVGADPQIVCFSRGLLADTMQPYPVPLQRAWWDFRP